MDERIVVVGRDGRAIVDILLAHGFDVAYASSLPEALREIDDQVPDVLVSHVGTDPNSFEMMRRVTVALGTNPVPVIAVLASEDGATYEAALRCGVSDFVREPIVEPELVTRVRNLCRQRTLAALVRGQKTLLERRVDDLLATREELAAVRGELDRALRRGPAVMYSQEPGAAGACFDSPQALDASVLTFVDDSVSRVLGYRPEEMVDVPGGFRDVVHPGDRRRLSIRSRALLREGRYSGEYRVLHQDGSYRVVRDQASLVRSEAGAATAVVGCLCDVSLEQATRGLVQRNRGLVRKAQRMGGARQLAGCVAHDFNNLLAVIVGYCQIASRSLPARHVSRSSIDQVMAAAARAQSSTRLLMQLARQGESRRTTVGVNAAVRSAVKLVAPLVGERIRISTRLQAKLPALQVDRTQLEQVLLNLFINARDAMPKGGALIITTHRQGPREPGGHACVAIEVSDSGTGMDDRTLARCFEPFFTTKPGNRGTGLGLYNVLQTTQQWGGSVTVETELGKGTTFRLLLPVRPSEAVPAPELQPPEPAAESPTTQDVPLLHASG